MTFRKLFLSVVPWSVILWAVFGMTWLQFLVWYPNVSGFAIATGIIVLHLFIGMMIFALVDVTDKTRLKAREVLSWLWHNGYVIGFQPINLKEFDWNKYLQDRKRLESMGWRVLYDRRLPFSILFKSKKEAAMFRLQNTHYKIVNIKVQKWYHGRIIVPEGMETGYCTPNLK